VKIESLVMVVPKVLFLESFYGGSHEVFARGWRDTSEFDIELVTLPARRHRLRARTAALEFSNDSKTYLETQPQNAWAAEDSTKSYRES
jgi:hypothetical protein